MRIFRAWRHISSVTDLDIGELKKEGIKLIIMDFDNTLAFHGSDTISSNIIAFIDVLKKAGFSVYILSNAKKNRMVSVLHGIGLEGRGSSFKPFTGALNKAIRCSGFLKKETVLIGDQIFTDIMAGNMAGIKTMLVDRVSRRETGFIKLKRMAENIVLKKERKS